MKTLKQILLYSFFLIFLTNGSCEKPTIDPPTGDHTFSCYIDEELFVPKGCVSCIPYDDGLSFHRFSNFYSIYAKDFEEYTVFFNILDFSVGTFYLTEGSRSFHDNSVNHAIVRHNGVYYLSKENSGSVTFTEVTDTNVMGAFEFTLYNENNDNDVIHVTNGNFDN